MIIILYSSFSLSGISFTKAYIQLVKRGKRYHYENGKRHHGVLKRSMVVCECAIDKCIIFNGDREVMKRKFMNGLLAAAGAAVRSVPAANRGEVNSR